MKRTIILGLVFSGVIAVANGCSSTPPTRDYHEYSNLRAGQSGSGDTIGTAMFAVIPSDAAVPSEGVGPPRLVAVFAAEVVVAPESGHSVYWEQPEIFNRAVLDFVGKHSR